MGIHVTGSRSLVAVLLLTAPTVAAKPGTVVTFPLPAALAVLGSILLALLTAVIVARRRAARWCAFAARGFAALGAPARRRRRLAVRRSLARRFATDTDSVRRAYETIGDVAAATDPAEPVYALSVGAAGPAVWLSASGTLDAPWQQTGSTRWQRPATALRPPSRETPGARAEQAAACLVRVGADAAGEPVFVDLSRLDGVLSVSGDRAVARDVVRNLLAEIARVRPDTPVAVVASARGGAALAVPAGLARRDRLPARPPTADRAGQATVRGAATRQPVNGLVVLTGAPDEREAADLLALCGTAAAGWTGLVCGPVDAGAHWRWHAAADGSIDIPVLGVGLTVPA